MTTNVSSGAHQQSPHAPVASATAASWSKKKTEKNKKINEENTKEMKEELQGEKEKQQKQCVAKWGKKTEGD